MIDHARDHQEEPHYIVTKNLASVMRWLPSSVYGLRVLKPDQHDLLV